LEVLVINTADNTIIPPMICNQLSLSLKISHAPTAVTTGIPFINTEALEAVVLVKAKLYDKKPPMVANKLRKIIAPIDWTLTITHCISPALMRKKGKKIIVP
jgi:hypothetical protein